MGKMKASTGEAPPMLAWEAPNQIEVGNDGWLYLSVEDSSVEGGWCWVKYCDTLSWEDLCEYAEELGVPLCDEKNIPYTREALSLLMYQAANQHGDEF